MITIDTTNMCSHLQRKLFEEDGMYHSLWISMQYDPELTAVVRSRQLHIYRNGKKILVLAGKSAPQTLNAEYYQKMEFGICSLAIAMNKDEKIILKVGSVEQNTVHCIPWFLLPHHHLQLHTFILVIGCLRRHAYSSEYRNQTIGPHHRLISRRRC